MLTNPESLWRQACAAAIAGLPQVGPGRISALLSDATPESAWASLGEEGVAFERLRKTCSAEAWPDLRKLILRQVHRTDPLDVLARYEREDVAIWTAMASFPERLTDDPWAPLIMFAKGHTEALDNVTVGIIGTRHCTLEGKRTAERLGCELSEAGVSVVSGLALGIDGAAHTGALKAGHGARPVAVVGSGADVIYPRRHADLWQSVASEGLLLTESPLGASPERWRFPARNRIIAGLADIIVVVESHETGGSLLTVNEAIRRGRQVMAVPGSINAPASRGVNALLRDGCAPVCGAEDVLSALSLTPTASRPVPLLPALTTEDDVFLSAVDWQPTTTDEVMQRTSRSLGEVAAALSRLQQLGYLIGMGGWWQRVAEAEPR